MRNIQSLRFKILGIMLGLFTVLTVSANSVFAADSYPSKPVRLITPVSPGGSVDLVARLIATKLSERLGKQVVVENIGGAGGIIGTERAAKANPDGYTLILIGATQAIQPALQKVPYDLVKSFTPITKLGAAPFAVIVHPSVSANSVKELITLAKQKPGQLIFAGAGNGSIIHMAEELFKMVTDINFKLVQFNGSGPAIVDLLGSHSHAMMGSIPQFLPHIKSGKLKILATTGSTRSFLTPDVPTIAEAGVSGCEVANWFGILAPAGTPALVVDRLNKELKVSLDSDEVKKLFMNDGLNVDYLGPTEFGTFLDRDMAQWARVIKNAKIKLEE
jgi:tripartite-type tricarboxylate transporter receptor subunit TctC